MRPIPTPIAHPACRLGTAATGFENAEPSQEAGWRRRKLPVDEDGDRRRGEEAVAEAPEAVPRAVIEPQEEDRRQDEVPDEVEQVHRLHQLGEAEERSLNRLLPGEVE